MGVTLVTADGKEFEVEMKIPTKTARKEFRKIEQKKYDAQKAFAEKYPALKDFYLLSREAQVKMIEGDKEFSEKLSDYRAAAEEFAEDWIIKVFREMVAVHKLEKWQRDLINSPWPLKDEDDLPVEDAEPSFWEIQNLEAMKEGIDSFRKISLS